MREDEKESYGEYYECFKRYWNAYTYIYHKYTYEVFVIISDKYYEQMLRTKCNTKATTTKHKLNVYYMPINIISSKCSQTNSYITTYTHTHKHTYTDEVIQIQRHRVSKLP